MDHKNNHDSYDLSTDLLIYSKSTLVSLIRIYLRNILKN